MFDLKYFQAIAKKEKSFFLAGCDEVGRGPLAGPVVAACASIEVKVFDQEEILAFLKILEHHGITDSKKLKSKERQHILNQFSFGDLPMKNNHIYSYEYSKNISLKIIIKEIHADIIDQINILQASLRAMKEAMEESCSKKLSGLVLIDGNRKFKHESKKIALETIVKGDSKSLLIGLASIAAKEYRDLLMKNLSVKYPEYGWEHNAGYPTQKHLEAITLMGVTELHRLSFKGVKEVYEERGYRGI